jgi:hypothetical protein
MQKNIIWNGIITLMFCIGICVWSYHATNSITVILKATHLSIFTTITTLSFIWVFVVVLQKTFSQARGALVFMNSAASAYCLVEHDYILAVACAITLLLFPFLDFVFLFGIKFLTKKVLKEFDSFSSEEKKFALRELQTQNIPYPVRAVVIQAIHKNTPLWESVNNSYQDSNTLYDFFSYGTALVAFAKERNAILNEDKKLYAENILLTHIIIRERHKLEEKKEQFRKQWNVFPL